MNTDQKQMNIAVLGAGISGLSAAYWLRQRGFSVTVYEASDRVGGCIQSESIQGVEVEWGPNTVLETCAELRQLADDLGLQSRKYYGNARAARRYILRGGKLCALPGSPLQLIRSGLFSFSAKLRLLLEPWISRNRCPDPSLAQFVERRLGREFLQYAIDPFVAGVSGGVPQRLSTQSAFPKLWRLEQTYGSLIRGMFLGARQRRQKRQQGQVPKDKARMFSFAGGLHMLTQALGEQVADSLLLSHAVQNLTMLDKGCRITDVQGEQRDFTAVISTLPAQPLASLWDSLDTDQAAKIRAIRYCPLVVVNLLIPVAQIGVSLDGFGFLTPACEQRNILGAIWGSVIFPHKTTQHADQALLTVFVGGERQPHLLDMDDDNLKKELWKDLQEVMQIQGDYIWCQLRRWPQAIPQYEVGYKHLQEMFAEIEKKYPQMYLAGNIRAGVSLGDSVLCSYQTVERLCRDLGLAE